MSFRNTPHGRCTTTSGWRYITERGGKAIPADRAYARGHLTVWLNDKKLRGGFALTIAVPVSWDDVASRSLKPQGYTIKNIYTRLSRRRDPWAGFWRRARGLARPRQKLDALLQSEE